MLTGIGKVFVIRLLSFGIRNLGDQTHSKKNKKKM